MKMKKTHHLKVVTGKYVNAYGVEKMKYLTVGSMFTSNQGYFKIKIDNPHPAIEGGWDGWMNVYEIKEEDRIPVGAPKDEEDPY
jgi:hypothetical protein